MRFSIDGLYLLQETVLTCMHVIYTSFVVGKDYELEWHMFHPPGVNVFELSPYNLDLFFFSV